MNGLAGNFAETALRYPNQVALESKAEGKLTYRELDLRVCEFSDVLEGYGVTAGDRVALVLPKSQFKVVVILSVIRLGAAYVPLDVAAPFSRNKFVIAEAKPKLILAAPGLLGTLDGVWDEEPIIPDEGEEFVALIAADDAARDELPGLAYILFTSGSTGKPKGVAISEAAALAFVSWASAEFNLRPTDSVASVVPFHFDLSIFDLHATLTSGARLVLISEAATKNPRLLAGELAELGASFLYTTPTSLRLLVSHGKCETHNLTGLRQVLYAGEAYPVADLVRLMETLPEAEIANLYGPTETNVVTFHRLRGVPEPGQQKNIPIGRACPYARLLLWDDGPVNQVPDAEGELLVAGDSLAVGYLDPEATSRAFISYNDERFYHTGDLVWVDDQENLIFLGRKDRMVKRRGYRIEPAEIEAALQLHPAVSRAAITTGTAKDGGVKLVAHYEVTSGEPAPTKLDLMAYCREHLPLYMVPDGFRQEVELPRTSSQKTDYATLQAAVDEE
ncbi:amino acid adenylation domain-containing protein [Neolewinella aurantiaca]|uniref:Amino acid adenylation domain-containing protein n=1 Tax=Neolewinella aurantiaca TaxID=2602767 RepID=A0A5C7F611_9BACT|nr:amino acid adenylation domain-containing protein [Neolewinella aurantiaca]TXF85443.1 amino acid adenylation domain-containing protein [Neolewinella aurantiaca]